jgi:hypothetical protein
LKVLSKVDSTSVSRLRLSQKCKHLKMHPVFRPRPKKSSIIRRLVTRSNRFGCLAGVKFLEPVNVNTFARVRLGMKIENKQ